MNQGAFNTSLLKLARQSRGLTQVELSQKLGIAQATLSKIQRGVLAPSEELIDNLCETLDYPKHFFFNPSTVINVEGHYRRKSSISVKSMDEYIAKMTLAEMQIGKLLDEIDLPETNLPKWDIEKDGSISDCAMYLRQYWRVPKGRIENLSKLLEDNGVLIIELDLGEMDGFSTFIHGSIPAIFLNSNLPGDRYRLTMAHEMAHLIIHFGFKIGPERDVEGEAYLLGILFLVPIDSVSPYFFRLNIDKLLSLKAYWMVSMQALIRHAQRHDKITVDQFKYLYKQMGALGYRTREPINVHKEKPLLLREMANLFINDLGYTKEELANILELNISDLEQNYFGTTRKMKLVVRPASGIH